MPVLYSKKIGRHKIDNRVRKRVEERDAIIWSIDSANDIVNLKIQGSDTLVKAHYHQVIHTSPGYLKVGAAVMVRFRRGNKGFVDVIGSGRAIPTAVEGGSSTPDITSSDMIMSGMEVAITDPETMYVSIASGVYRISNTLYTFSGTENFFYVMYDSPPPLLMGTDAVTMGGQFYAVEIEAAPTTVGYGRYDIIVIGTDSTIDVIKGTEVNLSTTEPTMPTVPAGHILVDYIFVQYGDTAITQDMIGLNYDSPKPVTITVTISGSWITYIDGDPWLEWNPSVTLPITNPSCSITITAKDQYGSTYNFGGVRASLTKSGGAGQIYGGYTGWDDDYVEANATTSVSFQYQRDQTDSGDIAGVFPVFTFECQTLSTSFTIYLQTASML